MKRILAAALLISPLSLFSQTLPAPIPSAEDPKLSDKDMASILKQLEALEGTITKSRGASFGTALAAFRTALTSDQEARNLYMGCYKVNHFDRTDSKEADFTAWKTKNEAKFKDPEFLVGIRYQLEYLILSIQAQDAKDVGTVFPALKEFIIKEIVAVEATYKHNTNGAVQIVDKTKSPKGQVIKTVRTGGGGTNELQQILDKSVKGSEFSKTYLLDEYLRLKEWEYTPMDFKGIYENAILPYYRERKPAELGAQWDALIATEFKLQQTTRSETEYQLFYTEKWPERQWTKNKDLLDNKIKPISALAELLKIVREHPTHPRAAEWLKELREYVNQYQPPAAPSVTDAPPPAPFTTEVK